MKPLWVVRPSLWANACYNVTLCRHLEDLRRGEEGYHVVNRSRIVHTTALTHASCTHRTANLSSPPHLVGGPGVPPVAGTYRCLPSIVGGRSAPLATVW